MQVTITKKSFSPSFLLSVLLHIALLFFLCSITTIVTLKQNLKDKPTKPPQLYIPSYVFKGAITPPHSPSIREKPSQAIPHPKAEPPVSFKQKVPSQAGTLAFQPQRPAFKKPENFHPESILNMSRNFIQHRQTDSAISNQTNPEPPILLIGDRQSYVDPLIKLVGRALSANFHYPQIQGMFGARGRVYIELVLHPEGYFSDVQIVKASEIEDFNAAALYAVNKAPTVFGVDKFLPKAKRFVVGFIFE